MLKVSFMGYWLLISFIKRTWGNIEKSFKKENVQLFLIKKNIIYSIKSIFGDNITLFNTVLTAYKRQFLHRFYKKIA